MGRTVLVILVMFAMANYEMQGVALLNHLCEKLDKINRDFGEPYHKKKRENALGWMEQNHQTKEQGGLGIQAVKGKNLALLAKPNWRMYQEKDALWARIILKNYCS